MVLIVLGSWYVVGGVEKLVVVGWVKRCVVFVEFLL